MWICEKGYSCVDPCDDCDHYIEVDIVRHGHWRDYEGNYVGLDKEGNAMQSCYCSECGDWLTASDEYPCRGYFCPNCGAKMDGKGEGE